MKRYVFAAGVLLLSANFVSAQETSTPAFEVGVNYSFIHVNTEQGNTQYGENGGSGFVEYNLNQTIGLVADFGGYNSGNLGRKTFSYLFGPRLNWRMSRVVPYVQFLFGGANQWGLPNAAGTSTAQNSFAMAAGGGVDVNITQRISIKPIQVEYFMTQLPQSASDLNIVQNDLRYSAGVVFRFGAK